MKSFVQILRESSEKISYKKETDMGFGGKEKVDKLYDKYIDNIIKTLDKKQITNVDDINKIWVKDTPKMNKEIIKNISKMAKVSKPLTFKYDTVLRFRQVKQLSPNAFRADFNFSIKKTDEFTDEEFVKIAKIFDKNYSKNNRNEYPDSIYVGKNYLLVYNVED